MPGVTVSSFQDGEDNTLFLSRFGRVCEASILAPSMSLRLICRKINIMILITVNSDSAGSKGQQKFWWSLSVILLGNFHCG